MNKVPEIVLQSIKENLDNIERVSSNTSNVTTPGFKAHLINKVGIDSSQGEIAKSGRYLDIAIEGSGWFVARKGDSWMLTRNGQFNIDASGHLVTSSGYILQGRNGGIFLGNDQFELRTNGEILVEGVNRGKLLAVEPAQWQKKQYQGGEIYISGGQELELSSNSLFRQGYIEQSNVQPSDAVLQLMILNKHTQSIQKSYTAYDQILQKTITELGK